MDRVDACPDKMRVFCAAVGNADPVSGHTHNFYRYPARFSPVFAKSVIESFSKPGDTVLDPFVGGGTAAVEALAAGRKFIGVDLNPIATFVTSVKSRPLSPHKLALARNVLEEVVACRPWARGTAMSSKADPRFLNAPWWIRGILYRLMAQLSALADGEVLEFLQCGVLRTAQWAMDCRARMPASSDFMSAFHANVSQMAEQMDEYRRRLRLVGLTGARSLKERLLVLARSTAGLDGDERVPVGWLPVRLVVTSPPYPGVHVLYHRWQVQGRRETPTPFAILNMPDGRGASYFTLGSRHGAGVRAYFGRLTACFSSVARLLDRDALVVQLVSFAQPEIQTPQFLEAMQLAGFQECSPRHLGLHSGDRLWRSVPNRKWYTHVRPDIASGKEIVFFHRLRGGAFHDSR